MIESGFVDWIVSTGANLYHDTHFALDLPLHQSRPNLDDLALRQNDVIRIYDIVFDYKTLLDTDSFYRELIRDEVFARPMGTAEFHHEVGRYLHGRQETRPAFAQPARRSLMGRRADLHLEPRRQLDRHEPRRRQPARRKAPDRHPARRQRDRRHRLQRQAQWRQVGRLILGGGSPKNFILQTEPQIQEVLGLSESGHDYFLQVTDARPDTGGLSGATASEAMTWGKVDPDTLPDSVTCYTDSTIALPLLTAYARARHAPRPLRRLYDQIPQDLRDDQLEYEQRLRESGKQPGVRDRHA